MTPPPAPAQPDTTAPETQVSGAARNFEGYRVSPDGTIWQRQRPDRPLRPKLASNGYLRVNINHRGLEKTYFVHRIVAHCFIGARPDGMEVNHKDGDKLNNAATNLEYVTRSQNELHAIHVLGRGCGIGERHRLAILTEDTVRAIRTAYRSERLTYKELGQRFDITRHHARNIVLRKSWAWLSDLEGEPC